MGFDTPCFLDIVSNMLGETYTEVSDDVVDVAGEICNQVFGVAKKNLNDQGYDIKSAIPTVVNGKQNQIRHLVEGPCITIEFKTSAGRFTVEASFQNF